MKKFNYKKAIREMEKLKLSKDTIYFFDYFHTNKIPGDWYNQALKSAIQIIKDNIEEVEAYTYKEYLEKFFPDKQKESEEINIKYNEKEKS